MGEVLGNSGKEMIGMDKDLQNSFLKTGTTTVGLLGKGFVVIAADKRATAGNLIVDKNTEKVIKINDTMGLTIAGSVSDLQLIIKYLKAELKLKELRTGRTPTAKEAANLLSSINYNNIRKYSPILGVCHFLFAGTDPTGPHLYDLFPDGSITEITEKSGFVASGSGSVFAYGVLEDTWKKDLSEKEAIDLALRSVNAALQRDTASGQGADVMVIDSKGVRVVAHKSVNTHLQ